jgi:hypothetical protein
VVKCLVSKHKALSLNPGPMKKKIFDDQVVKDLDLKNIVDH